MEKVIKCPNYESTFDVSNWAEEILENVYQEVKLVIKTWQK